METATFYVSVRSEKFHAAYSHLGAITLSAALDRTANWRKKYSNRV